MSEFQTKYNTKINELTGTNSDKILIELSKFIVLNKSSLISEDSQNTSDNLNINNDTKINSIVHKFPIVFNKKEVSGYVKPKFNSEDYVEYLTNINNSYSKLPMPNIKIDNIEQIIGTNSQNWCKITSDDVTNFIFTRNSKGKDNFGLTYNLLQKSLIKCSNISQDIAAHFNNILNNDYELCTDWCSNVIKPNFKGGDEKDPSRFRPLIIMPLFVRIFDGILSKKLHDICLLDDRIVNKKIQKAILKDKSGLFENIYRVNTIVNRINTNESNKLLLFLDITNAYGSVNYEIMHNILKRKNFSPFLTSYFKRYYTLITSKYKDKQFVWKNGLLQGSSLSNILFLIYIDTAFNNLMEDLNNIGLGFEPSSFDINQDIHGFVDDFALNIPRDDKEQKRFEFMEIILSMYGLNINFKKTFFLSNKADEENISFGNNLITKVTEKFKYLGNYLIHNDKFIIDQMITKMKDSQSVIETFNIDMNEKLFVFYHMILLKIIRQIEFTYLFNGFTPNTKNLFELLEYHLYRITNKHSGGDITKKICEYMYSKLANKISKNIDISLFANMIVLDDQLKTKFNVNKLMPDKEHNFSIIAGNTPICTIDKLKSSLVSIKESKSFPKSHFIKMSKTFYASNIIEEMDEF